MSKQDSKDGKSDGKPGYRNAETLRELYEQRGMTIPEIAEYFDVADSTIHRWIERNKIETRQRGTGKNPYATFDIDGQGYERWKDWDLGDYTTIRVHQLLAISEGHSPSDVFGGEYHIHHRNGIPWDNRPENIQLLTPSEHGNRHFVGSDNPISKLTETEVEEIKQLAHDGVDNHVIAESYPVVPDTIARIVSGRSWKHVE